MSLQALQALVHEASLAPTDPKAVGRLVHAFHQVRSQQDREKAIDAAAACLAAEDPRCRLLRELSQAPELPTRLLALQIASRLPAGPELTPPWRQLLADQTLPLGMQFAAVVVQVPGRGAGAVEMLYAFVRGLDRPAAMERLLSLQNRLGKIPAIQEVRLWLGVPLGPRCPRCGVELKELAMRDHLWKEHRLIIRDELICDPWVQIEDTVADAGDDPDRLASCFEQAMSVDGENGLARLEQLLAKYGLEAPPPPARDGKDDKDNKNGKDGKDGKPSVFSSCPRCGGTVLPPVTLPTPALSTEAGKLTLGGFRVEITETGLVPQLEVTTPHAVVYSGREPGRFLTPRGATLVLAGIPVLLALVLALRLADPRIAVAVCLSAAALGYGFAHYRWKVREPALERAINHAWRFFAARANSSNVNIADTEFVAGLAALSFKLGRPAERARSLERIIAQLEPALRTSLGLMDRLVLLWRLFIEDSARLGRDPTAPTARLLLRCLEGQLPLRLADRLLAGWDAGIWTPANRARLRIRLAGLAFENGVTVGQLKEAGRLAPALGQLLGDPLQLNDLYRLWEKRLDKPWERCGEAISVFEAADVAPQHLERNPDLLLYPLVGSRQQDPGDAVLVCGRGVVVGEKAYRKRPIRLDPAQASLAEAAERWLDFYLREWATPPGKPAPEDLTGWKEQIKLPDARKCPACGERFLTRPGEKGIALEVGEPRA